MKGKPKVLMVENDLEFSRNVNIALKEVYDIQVINLKEEVLPTLDARRSDNFDLIILDLHLGTNFNRDSPDGLKLLEEIRRYYSRLPVLVYTEDARREITYRIIKDFKYTDIVVKMELGFTELLHKIDSLIQETPKKTAFISYSSKDGEFARKLTRKLQRQGINVKIDEKQVNVGKSISKEIANSIQDCDYFLLILSPDAFESNWVKRELSFVSKRKRQESIVPIIYKNFPIPDEIELYLGDNLKVDFSIIEKLFDDKVSKLTDRFFEDDNA